MAQGLLKPCVILNKGGIKMVHLKFKSFLFLLFTFSLLTSTFAGIEHSWEELDGAGPKKEVLLDQALAEATSANAFIEIISSCPEETKVDTICRTFDKFLSLNPAGDNIWELMQICDYDTERFIDINGERWYDHPKFYYLDIVFNYERERSDQAIVQDIVRLLTEHNGWYMPYREPGWPTESKIADPELLIKFFQHRIKNGLKVFITAEDLGVLQVRLKDHGFEIGHEWLPNAFPEVRPGIRTSGYQITEIRRRPSIWTRVNPLNWFKKNGKAGSGSGNVGVSSKAGGRVGGGRASELEISISTVRVNPEGTVADEPVQPGREWDSIEDRLRDIEERNGIRVNPDGSVAIEGESAIDTIRRNLGDAADRIVRSLHLSNATGELDSRFRGNDKERGEGRRAGRFGIRGKR